MVIVSIDVKSAGQRQALCGPQREKKGTGFPWKGARRIPGEALASPGRLTEGSLGRRGNSIQRRGC